MVVTSDISISDVWSMSNVGGKALSEKYVHALGRSCVEKSNIFNINVSVIIAQSSPFLCIFMVNVTRALFEYLHHPIT